MLWSLIKTPSAIRHTNKQQRTHADAMGDMSDAPVFLVGNINIRTSLQGTSKIPILLYSPDEGCKLVFRGFTPSPPEHVAPPVDWSQMTDADKFTYIYLSIKTALARVDDMGVLPIGNDEHLYVCAAMYAVMEHSSIGYSELSSYIFCNVNIIGTFPDHLAACATCFMKLHRTAFPDLIVSMQNFTLDAVHCEAMEHRMATLAIPALDLSVVRPGTIVAI